MLKASFLILTNLGKVNLGKQKQPCSAALVGLWTHRFYFGTSHIFLFYLQTGPKFTPLTKIRRLCLRGQHIVVRKCYINSYCAARKSWIISKTMFLKLWIYFSNVFIAVGCTILPAGFRGSCYSKFCCTWFCSVQKPPVIAAFFHSDLLNILNQLEKCYHPSTQHSRMICLSSIHRAVAAVSISDSLYVKVL